MSSSRRYQMIIACLIGVLIVVLIAFGVMLSQQDKSEIKSTTTDSSEQAESSNAQATSTSQQTYTPEASTTTTYSVYDYVNTFHVSKQQLIDKWIADGETEESAQSMADLSGIKWQYVALDAAKAALDSQNYSYDGLIDYLLYNEFTEEEAAYAADHCGADWNQHALETANRYIRDQHPSKDGVEGYLAYQKYSHEEIEYALSQITIDSDDAATETAKSYLRSMRGTSRQGLIDQLIYEGFTGEEAANAVDACDVDWNEQAVD